MPFISLGQCPVTPWKNGGGTTRELFKIGTAPFDVRISVADVASDGPFSLYPDHDRILILLNKSIELHSGAHSIVLGSLNPHYFAGDEPIHSKLVEGEIKDFNVFYRKGRKASAEVRVVKDQKIDMDDETFIYVLKDETLYYQERKIEFKEKSIVIIIKIF